MEKPSVPKGTRDFGPATMAKRQFIFNTIRGVFQNFGFQPLETPAMENLSTLTGKYGDEGDQLLFRILNSGDFSEVIKDRIDRFTKGQIKEDFKVEFESFLKNFTKSYGEGVDQFIVSKQLDEFQELFFKDDFFADLKSFVHANSFEISGLLNKKVNSDTIVDFFFEKFYTINQNEILNHLISAKKLRNDISEKGLRYDLTVPFARYVVMNRHEISFPFKRYQIQPVWRADRPQKGRYREFYQCDADVVGTNSLICETEIILMIRDVFSKLGIPDYSIKINHRGILSGIAELICPKENETALFVAIDKLDKIGEDGVRQELHTKGFDETKLDILFSILRFRGDTSSKIEFLREKFTSPTGKKGIDDLNEVLSLLASYGKDDSHVEFDIALARGLSYYTGCIFEVKINNVAIGSVSGGGRYDNLTALFGDKENLSGVGFSFGVDRIYDAMEELKLFPKDAQRSSKVLICHFDKASLQYGLRVLAALRQANIPSEIYPDESKIKKQLDYSNKRMIPYTIVIGSDEVATGQLAFKNMESGEQAKLSIDQIIERLKHP